MGEQKRIVVTGANKGIGLATVERILDEHPETFVYLGSRDEGRGAEARAGLLERHADWSERVEVLPIDVGRDDSVQAAAKRVIGPLYGVVNNAGIGGKEQKLEDVLQVNAYGPHRVGEAFAPRLQHDGPKDKGRAVIVTSAAGPSFVQRCSAERQQFFLRDDLTWPELDAFMNECKRAQGKAGFEALGLGSDDAYGLSKACANSVMLIFARQHPELIVNACTPGFIATDMTKGRAKEQGKTPEELGMKTPHEGATATLHLLFGDLPASGWYYGSDAQRSPLDRYRSPGDPPFQGD